MAVARQQHVGRLDVAVDGLALLVHVPQGQQRAAHHPRRARLVERRVAAADQVVRRAELYGVTYLKGCFRPSVFSHYDL